jgi:asparagine synthase (glutamine-hydrolysing)
MCGIAGYIGQRVIDPERIQVCLKAMGQRGPDHQDYFSHTTDSGRNAYLLFSRLSIIDLDARANQPFHIGSRTMVYNGELYNYLELRQELEAQGCHFRTQGDTEIMLQTIAQRGWQGLDQCEGMWGLAVYDQSDGSLLLSRDRFGEKPLHLYQTDDGLYFGSEVKFIFTLLGHSLPVNTNHLYRFWVNGYKSLYKTSETFFQGIEELPPASALIIDGEGNQQRQRYWQPEYHINDSMSYADAVEGARETLIHSVKLRLRADVPLAFCMSGGIDSNALISIAKNVLHYDVHGFTIVNTDARYSEQDMIDLAVESQDLRHTAIPLQTDGFLDGLKKLVAYHDAPVYTITAYANWLLMESIGAQRYRISISGAAADELFSGYYDHHAAYLYALKDDPAQFSAALDNWNRYIKPIVRNPYLQNPRVFIENPALRDHIFLNNDQFAAYLTGDWSETFTESTYHDELLRNRMLNEIFYESIPVILHQDDLNAMYYSIENRSPYLDRVLFEFCNTIPTRHLVQNGAAKSVLREAVRGIVPDAILDNRRKVGFNAPIRDFLDVNDPDVRAYLLDDSPIFEHIRRDKITALLDKPELPNSESKFLFYFTSSKLFLEEYA